MTVVVAYKYAANPQDASVAADGNVNWSRAKSTVSEYDPVAIQLGRDLADASGAELVGVSVGAKDAASSMAKKNALSKRTATRPRGMRRKSLRRSRSSSRASTARTSS